MLRCVAVTNTHTHSCTKRSALNRYTTLYCTELLIAASSAIVSNSNNNDDDRLLLNIAPAKLAACPVCDKTAPLRARLSTIRLVTISPFFNGPVILISESNRRVQLYTRQTTGPSWRIARCLVATAKALKHRVLEIKR